MKQIVFLAILYIFGVLLGLLFRRKIPIIFIALSGFLWGALGWVFFSLIWLSIGLYNIWSMGCTLILACLLILVINIKKGIPSRNHLFLLGITASFFVLLTFIFENLKVISTTSDSEFIVFSAIKLAFSGLKNGYPISPMDFGIFIPIIHSSASFLGMDYFTVFHPMISVTFVAIYIYLFILTTESIHIKPVIGFGMAILGVLAINSSSIFIWQTFYIHTNYIFMVFFLVSIITFWLGVKKENEAWFKFSCFSLLGLGLTRTEAPLLVIIMVILMAKTMSYQIRSHWIAPLLLFLSVWYVRVLFIPDAGTTILSSTDTLVIATGCILLAIFMLFSNFAWFEHYFLPKLSVLLSSSMLFGLLITFVLKPALMYKNLTNILIDLLQTGGWGITWYLLILLLILSCFLPKIENEMYLVTGPFLLAGLILLVGFFRLPYRTLWTDSANRMFIEVQPSIFFFVFLKHSQAISNTFKRIIKNKYKRWK